MAKKITHPPEKETLERPKLHQRVHRYIKCHRLKLIFIAIAFFVLGVFLVFLTNTSLSANFADNVLRPLIGSKKTVELESILFNGEDHLNQIVYKLNSPNVEVFNNEPGNHITNPTDQDRLELNSIASRSAYQSLIPGEGQWQPIKVDQFPSDVVLAKTFIRPDPLRSYAIVSVVKADMQRLKLSAVAGTKEPAGEVGRPGPGRISQDILSANSLVAAFNGGFQYRDGQYGMIVENKVYLPLRFGLATLAIDNNSQISIFKYIGQNIQSDKAIRQNGDMLIENSKVIPQSSNNQYSVWGRTVTNSMYTWRSGIGVTKEGDLIYAVGPSLVPKTLAQALLDAGAINAMQLDINPFWVRFVLFNPLQTQGTYQHYSLVKGMFDGGEQFLNGDQKDFFYLYK